ncbi:amidohydrolase [Fulvivirga sp. RKSG066]|uniref:amidohydrolase family protein n=1 Tax=Fulvivirga aurantia TaxID=2529383 RepID=UPI0012BD49FB|nr:amidohydrolase family protein [Fulvivirga aurantia]MTI21864.1 amidohydrolase [Fulvivirga aurantia]
MKRLISIFSLLSVLSCSTSEKEPYDLVFANATVVDVIKGEVIENQLIAIKDDTIVRVVDMANQKEVSASKKIDLNGKYIMPGLWDNHVHFRGGDSLIAENRDMLPLFLKFGITTVRDAGGDITPSVLSWKENIVNKTLDGPFIFTSGPKLDGHDPAWPGSIQVTNSEQINDALDSIEAIEGNYVKMYDGSLTADTYYQIIEEAERRGLKTTGHMPMSADLLTAVDYGLDGTEHMYYVLKACSPKADSLTKLDLGYGMVSTLVDTYDKNLANQVYTELAKQNFYITPTLYIGKTLSQLADADHSGDSLLQYMGQGIQKTYQGRIDRAKAAKESGNNSRSKLAALTNQMITPMYEAGVHLLAGSDCGPYNSYVYPGESLHGELRALVKTGLNPQQALITSVVNGPKFFGLERYYGSVTNGKVADLLILEANPLTNIENLTSINLVVAKGKSYNLNELRDLLK